MSFNLIPCLIYADAPGAIEWLCEAFGFERQFVVEGDDGKIEHAQLTFRGGMVMLGSVREGEYARMVKTPGELGGINQSIYVVVEDADAHCERARAAGAEIVRELEDTEYGSRDYAAQDPEGNLWNFGTYAPGE